MIMSGSHAINFNEESTLQNETMYTEKNIISDSHFMTSTFLND